MTLRGRLSRLERQSRAYIAQHARRCASCNRSPQTVRTCVLLSPGEEIPDCPECGLPTDRQGRAVGHIGRDGECYVKAIVLDVEPRDLEVWEK